MTVHEAQQEKPYTGADVVRCSKGHVTLAPLQLPSTRCRRVVEEGGQEKLCHEPVERVDTRQVYPSRGARAFWYVSETGSNAVQLVGMVCDMQPGAWFVPELGRTMFVAGGVADPAEALYLARTPALEAALERLEDEASDRRKRADRIRRRLT